VFQRGHRLLGTTFSTRSTSAQGQRVAAIVAPRILIAVRVDLICKRPVPSFDQADACVC
jgi:hypothetical protein